MRMSDIKALALSVVFAASAATPTYAAVIKVGFAGVLTSAVNNTYDDPDIPESDFFQVGQAFSGSFAYDNDVPGFTEDDTAFFDLQNFNVQIGGQDFSDRFLPRQVFRSADGSVSFLSGGADQGGSTSIETTLNSSFQNYPMPGELNGKTATFSFADFYPLGGQVSGRALLKVDGFTPAVPEASTWAMMILGFGFVGFAMRRRKAQPGLVPALAAY
jgi:hypothetical protein